MAANHMHANEITPDRQLVQALIYAQFPHWAELSIKPINSAGTDNAI